MSTFLHIIGIAGAVLILILAFVGFGFICAEAGKDAVQQDRRSDTRTAEQIIADIGRQTQNELLRLAFRRVRSPGSPASDEPRLPPRP